MFFYKLLRVDDKGLALQSNSIKMQRVSGHVSKYTWNKQQKQNRMFTCKMGRIVAITQKTFSANFWYQQMKKKEKKKDL